jgi:C-terminal processing protease CtpA/Prc
MMKMISTMLVVLLALAGLGWGANSSRDFGGVGIDGVPRADGAIVVRQLVLGGPAQLAGLKVGDVITRIDSKSTVGSDFKDLVEHRLRGRAGTSVMLQVKRPGSDKPLSFNLIRRQLAVAGGKKEQPKGE